jgi:hypothetical protein
MSLRELVLNDLERIFLGSLHDSNLNVAPDRCGPGSRFRKCKIGVTIDLACDHGVCGVASLRTEAHLFLAHFRFPRRVST